MSVFKTLLLAAAFGASVVTSTTGATAQPRGPNLLVMAENAEPDTVPRHNRIFNRVIAELSEALIAKGFQVYDETAAGMGVTELHRIKREDVELIEFARVMNRPPIDVIMIFQIFISAKKSLYGDTYRPDIRITGRLLGVRSNQQLGSFEYGGDLELPPLPRTCFVPGPEPDRECLIEKVGLEARAIAGAVGQGLSEKLAAYMRPARSDVRELPPPGPGPGPEGALGDASGPPPQVREAIGDPAGCRAMGFGGNPFVLRFRGFGPHELTRLEEYMSAFQCYEHHRPIRADAILTEFWYETGSDQARLQRNLRIALEHLDVKGQVSSSGNTILIDKIVTIPRR
jgi:hypothetical protein